MDFNVKLNQKGGLDRVVIWEHMKTNRLALISLLEYFKPKWIQMRPKSKKHLFIFMIFLVFLFSGCGISENYKQKERDRQWAEYIANLPPCPATNTVKSIKKTRLEFKSLLVFYTYGYDGSVRSNGRKALDNILQLLKSRGYTAKKGYEIEWGQLQKREKCSQCITYNRNTKNEEMVLSDRVYYLTYFQDLQNVYPESSEYDALMIMYIDVDNFKKDVVYECFLFDVRKQKMILSGRAFEYVIMDSHHAPTGYSFSFNSEPKPRLYEDIWSCSNRALTKLFAFLPNMDGSPVKNANDLRSLPIAYDFYYNLYGPPTRHAKRYEQVGPIDYTVWE